jgi:farnesyl-diphosphate farnesyltransferase
MGLFLQKVNIIRDYLEDYVDGRAWWPQSIWKKYSKTGDLGYFANQQDEEVRIKSLQCLNELVTDALELGPDCLAYMSKLQCVEIFRFCAIPQVMAIATLDKLYANPDVFTGVVKIRKGMSCKLILQTNNLHELHGIFYQFATSIADKARRERAKGVLDPSFDRTIKACDAILELTAERAAEQRRAQWMPLVSLLLLALPIVIFDFFFSDVITLRRLVLVGVGFVYVTSSNLNTTPATNLKPASVLEKEMKKNV